MSESASIVSVKAKNAEIPNGNAQAAERIRRLEMRVEREHAGRHEAERLLETKSLELFMLNQQLAGLNAQLEQRVLVRTEELNKQRMVAERLVETDQLTNIASRASYSKEIAVRVREVSGGSQVGLLLIDVDNFKRVNDSLGHMAGDDLLVGISRRFKAVCRSDEIVARLGGDEFAVVFACDCAKAAREVAKRFRAVFQEPFPTRAGPVESSGSLGLALYPDQAASYVQLQQFADLALYHVKASGRGSMAMFERSLLYQFEERLRIEQKLRRAIEENEIAV